MYKTYVYTHPVVLRIKANLIECFSRLKRSMFRIMVIIMKVRDSIQVLPYYMLGTF